MITIDHIDFKYGRRRPAVFEDFSLRIGSGRICGLLGRNGTGKSTLLYLLSGLLFPQRGAVCFRGEDVARRRPEELRDIFLVPEEFSLPGVTLSRYVALNRPFYPRFSDELLASCLRDFDLASDLHLGQLSMGQKKKAFMSFALAAGTSLLLMDEPTNGLDIPSKSQFRRVVANCMTEERTIVVSTHQVRDVEALLDHVVMLEGSHILLDSPTAAICRRLSFEERPVGAPLDDVLYEQPSLAGRSVIARNPQGRETPLNLELLFNALLSAPALRAFIGGGRGADNVEPENTNRNEDI